MQGDDESGAFRLDSRKIVRESLRGAATLGATIGGGVAAYSRALRMAASGRLSPSMVAVAAVVPALGVGSSAMVDALSMKVLGKPTDPDGHSSDLLPWVSPVLNGLAAAAYRYAPIAKPRLGSVPDMVAQVLVAAGGGAAAYSTREWLAQQAVAQRKGKLPPAAWVTPRTPDRFVARTATQAASTALRLQVLNQPARAPKFFVPLLVTSCVPYGWREDLARHIAWLRKKLDMRKA